MGKEKPDYMAHFERDLRKRGPRKLLSWNEIGAVIDSLRMLDSDSEKGHYDAIIIAHHQRQKPELLVAIDELPGEDPRFKAQLLDVVKRHNGF